MSALVADRSVEDLVWPEEERANALRRAAGGGSTLEQVVSGVWEDLAARALAACPVCGDEMRAAAPGALPALCRGCGSELS